MRRVIAVLMLILLPLATAIGLYYHFIYLSEKRLEERIRSLIDAGLTKEEALAFDKDHKDWAINNRYNQSVISYAIGLKDYPSTTESLFQLTESVDKTASSLNNLNTLFKDKILTDEEASKFISNYPELVKDDGINATDTKLLQYHLQFPELTDTVIKIISEQYKRLSTLSTLQSSVVKGIIPEEKASDFIMKHTELALDDGINPTDLRFMEAYASLPGIVDKIIEKVRPEDRLFALDELTPYISKPLTEEQASTLIESWYPELFEVAKKTEQSVLFGDLDKPEPDGLHNFVEIFELATDPFKTNNWIKFVFDYSLVPAYVYPGEKDTRNLSALIDYIEFFEDNPLNVSKRIDFNPGDEKYFGKEPAWIDVWEDGTSLAAVGKNFTLFNSRLNVVPEDAQFLKMLVTSIESKGGIEEPRKMGVEVYLNGKLVDELSLEPRFGFHYITLKPHLDSDNDGIMNRDDPSPLVPQPRPVEGKVDIGAYCLLGWKDDGDTSDPDDWAFGYSLEPLVRYDSRDPWKVDWDIKWAREHGINTFILCYPDVSNPSIARYLRERESGFFNSGHFDQIYFAVLYEPSTDVLDSTVQLTAAMQYFSRIFSYPNYKRIDGRPMMFLFGEWVYPNYDVNRLSQLISEIRQTGKEIGYDPFIVGLIDPGITDQLIKKANLFDAVSAYIYTNGNTVTPYSEVVNRYIDRSKQWHELGKQHGFLHVPPIASGFSYKERYGRVPFVHSPDEWANPTPEEFGRMIEGQLSNVDPAIPILVGYAWNENGEGGAWEPTVKHGFELLNTLRDKISEEPKGGYPPDLVPTKSGIEPYRNVAIEKGYGFLGENLWDEAKGAYRECPPGSEGLENNYWGDDNYLALIFHRDYERFKDSERANRIQQFLEKNPPRSELGLRRWCVLSAGDYTKYQPYNNWEYADQVALDGIYYARIGNVEKVKECFNYLIEKMYSEDLIEDEATPENGHEYYKLALALILAHHLKNEDPTANRHIPILTEKLLKLQRLDGSWLTDDKLPSWPNTETTILILIALNLQTLHP